MIERLNGPDNPNLLLMNYERDSGVANLIVVPKQFFAPEIIEERKPLSKNPVEQVGLDAIFCSDKFLKAAKYSL